MRSLPQKSTAFIFFKDEDYRYRDGVYAVVGPAACGIEVWTRTTIWRSKFDSDFHNATIRQLKKRFGGYFRSDKGRNRYFSYEGPVMEKAEAGCSYAYERFHSNLGRVKFLLASPPLSDKKWFPIANAEELDRMNPRVWVTGLFVPFLVSVLEEYFRATYVALLRYSSKRERLFQGIRINGTELLRVGESGRLPEQTFVANRSFQNIEKVCASFRELENRLDLHGLLRRPYRRRRESLYETLDRLIQYRHRIIHGAEFDSKYGTADAQRDTLSIEAAVKRVYLRMIEVYGWSSDHPDL